MTARVDLLNLLSLRTIISHGPASESLSGRIVDKDPKKNWRARKVEVVDVVAIGTHVVTGYACPGWKPFRREDPTYPPSPEGERFRARRHDLGLSLGDVGRFFGIGPAEVSAIEMGKGKAFADWPAAFALLETCPKTSRG